MTDDDPIVVFLARQPDLLRRLLAEHVDDGTGHCRVCTVSAQTGYLVWPCVIARYVARASHATPLSWLRWTGLAGPWPGSCAPWKP